MALSHEQVQTESQTTLNILVYELSFGQPFSATKAIELAAPLVSSGDITGVDCVPKRFDTPENYSLQLRKNKVEAGGTWTPIIANTTDLLSQLIESKRLADAMSVLKIAGGVGILSEPYDAKAYGDTLSFVRQMRQYSQGLEHQIQTVTLHQSTLAHLEKTGQIKKWHDVLDPLGVVLIRTNGWSDRLGRYNPESYIPEEIVAQADRNGTKVAFVSDVFFQTVPDLKRRGIHLTAVDVVKLFQPEVFYVADAVQETYAQKLVPGDGNHEAEIQAALREFFRQGGRNVYIKVDPPVEHIVQTSQWIKNQWQAYLSAA